MNFLNGELILPPLRKKLNQAIGILSKICHHTSQYLLKSILFSVFNSLLIYGCQIWGQDHSNELKKIGKLQKEAMRIIKFLPNDVSITEKMERDKYPKIGRLYYISKHSLCERFTSK